MRILKFLGYGFLILFALSVIGRMFSSTTPASTITPQSIVQPTVAVRPIVPAKPKPQRNLQGDYDKEINELMRKPNAAYLAGVCGHTREHAEQMAALNHKSEEEQQIVGFKTAMNCLDSVLGHKEHFPGF